MYRFTGYNLVLVATVITISCPFNPSRPNLLERWSGNYIWHGWKHIHTTGRHWTVIIFKKRTCYSFYYSRIICCTLGYIIICAFIFPSWSVRYYHRRYSNSEIAYNVTCIGKRDLPSLCTKVPSRVSSNILWKTSLSFYHFVLCNYRNLFLASY